MSLPAYEIQINKSRAAGLSLAQGNATKPASEWQ